MALEINVSPFLLQLRKTRSKMTGSGPPGSQWLKAQGMAPLRWSLRERSPSPRVSDLPGKLA